TGLAFPISAAGMIVKAHPLIRACPHVDNAEGRRPGWPPLGNHGIHDGNLIGPNFCSIDPKRAGKQQASKLETHGAHSATRLRGAEVLVLAQTGELALARGLCILHDFPIVVLPRSVLPIGAAGAHRDVLASPRQMFVAIELETVAVPDVA